MIFLFPGCFLIIAMIFILYKSIRFRSISKAIRLLSVGERIFFWFLSGMAILMEIALFCLSSAASEKVVINEVCSNNFSVFHDENWNYPDYIELYNPTAMPVFLSGYMLTDKEEVLEGSNFGSVSIKPYGFFVISADALAEQAGHVDFKISDMGENIYLKNSFGEIIDSVEVPELEYNTSYSRNSDGSSEWKRKEATPAYTNNEAHEIKTAQLKPPDFSHESGFYDTSFYLEIKTDENQTIYYTLDGSKPTSSSLQYRSPILIEDVSLKENLYSARTDLSPVSDYTPAEKVDKATVINAIVYDDITGEFSEVETRSYFIDFNGKSEYKDLPVINIVSHPENLFDEVYGIYGNGLELEKYKEEGGMKEGELLPAFTDPEGNLRYLYMSSNAYNRGKEWEREAVIEYFDNNHTHIFSQKAGIRISGESTRNVIQKSFNVYAREIYDGNSTFPYEFFEGMPYSTFKLRNGGSDNQESKIKDPFLQKLAMDRAVSIQASKPCVVFLNGEYWGIYNLRERYKEEYFFNHYNIQKGNLLMIDSNSVSIGKEEAWHQYEKLLKFAAEHDMSNASNYIEISNMMDIQSFIDFYCINLYINNTDVAFDKNMAMWRTKDIDEQEYCDGKWRWMLYDLDGAIGEYESNTFTESEWWKEGFDLMDEILINSLMKNQDFRKLFCLSFMDIANTVYCYENVHENLMEWKHLYQKQVIKSHQRFFSEEISEKEYNEYITQIDEFFLKRSEFITSYLAQELELEGTKEEIRIQTNIPEAGSIKVNTAGIDLKEEWIGEYYTDFPVTVEVLENEGYRFTGWSGAAAGDKKKLEIEIEQGGITLFAGFDKIEQEEGK